MGGKGVRELGKCPLELVNLTFPYFLVDLPEEIIQYPKSCRMLSLNCVHKIPVDNSKQFFLKKKAN